MPRHRRQSHSGGADPHAPSRGARGSVLETLLRAGERAGWGVSHPCARALQAFSVEHVIVSVACSAHHTASLTHHARARARERQAIPSVRLTRVDDTSCTARGDARGLCVLLRRWQGWCSRARSPNIELHAQGSRLARQSGACEPPMPRSRRRARGVQFSVCARVRARTRQDRSPVVVEVSASADIFGAHSAALDSEVRARATAAPPSAPTPAPWGNCREGFF